jgi:hypothetical protein
VHLLASRAAPPAEPELIAEQIAHWTPRKRDLFSFGDVTVALDRLSRSGIL